jgi:glycosyltransferase involved in cell wall biosynthesis
MKKRFSIIVPVYNGESVIERCIQSVINLNYSNWELIIVNDGSKDATKDICKKYLADKRVKLINKQNSGVSDTRNRGIYESSGEYIVFLDADDYLDSGICSIFNSEMEKTDFCILGYTRHFENGSLELAKTSIMIEPRVYRLSEFPDIFGELYKFGFLNSPWAKCYKRELISVYFDKSYSLGEDLIFNLHYMLNCKDIRIGFESVYNYEIQSNGTLSSSLSNNGFQTLACVYHETLNLLDRLFTNSEKCKSYIKEKYILDMMVMLERNIKYNPKFKKSSSVQYILKQYDLNSISKTVSLKDFNTKWEIARKMLAININGGYIFLYYIKFIHFIKTLIFDKEYVYVRKDKNKNKRNYRH